MAKKAERPEAFGRGYFAARNGSDREANPYEGGSDDFRHWDDGYVAQKDGEDPPDEPQMADADD